MAKICVYCGEENDENATVCQGCETPFANSPNQINKTEQDKLLDGGYWQITCPQCGEIYRVDSADSRIKVCEKCEDEFDAEQISYERAIFISNCSACADKDNEVSEQKSEIPTKIELIDVLSNKAIADITVSGGVLGQWGTISKDYFKKYPQISHHHCIFFYSDKKWLIENLSNTNTTEVNGVYLEHGIKFPLKDGNKILLADLLFEVRYVY